MATPEYTNEVQRFVQELNNVESSAVFCLYTFEIDGDKRAVQARLLIDRGAIPLAEVQEALGQIWGHLVKVYQQVGFPKDYLVSMTIAECDSPSGEPLNVS